MNEREHIQKELEEIAPKLAMLKPEKNYHQAPPGYFEHLADRAMQKAEIEQGKSQSLKTQSWRSTILRIAAIVVIGLGIFFTGRYLQQPGDSTSANSQYLTDNYVIENVDEDVLIETIVSENIALNTSANEGELEVNDFYLEDLEENFLMEEL